MAYEKCLLRILGEQLRLNYLVYTGANACQEQVGLCG